MLLSIMKAPLPIGKKFLEICLIFLMMMMAAIRCNDTPRAPAPTGTVTNVSISNIYITEVGRLALKLGGITKDIFNTKWMVWLEYGYKTELGYVFTTPVNGIGVCESETKNFNVQGTNYILNTTSITIELSDYSGNPIKYSLDGTLHIMVGENKVIVGKITMHYDGENDRNSTDIEISNGEGRKIITMPDGKGQIINCVFENGALVFIYRKTKGGLTEIIQYSSEK